ncbi:hypothetical protein AB0G02_24555 [Actinosynnema sp. NPDC023658]|uniref:hypothetical protein n=1 Tax=Actinosynnema sp. NPDC023658 TaxID=3155465 RepID=UPI0033FAF15C
MVGARPADPAGLRSAGGRHRLATAWLFWTTPEGKAQSHAPDYFARLADGSGYRHPRHDLPEVAAALRAVLAEPPGLVDGAEAVGNPIAVQPVLFHLLWRCELDVELSVPLHPEAVVSR